MKYKTGIFEEEEMLGSSDKDTTPPLGSVILPVWRKKDSQIINYLRRKLGKQGLQRESQVSVTSGDEGNNQRSWGHRAFID